MSFPLSVIVPNLNHARFLPIALDALLAQSPVPKEIIVVDDASTDRSREIIKAYAARFPIIRPVYRSQTAGVIAAMNEFSRSLDSELIYFAAADDRVLPGFFARCGRLLAQHPRAGLCSTLTRTLDASGADTGVWPSPLPIGSEGYIDVVTARRILYRDDSWVLGNSTIYRREAILAQGGFQPELFSFSDGLMHRLIAVDQGACFIPEPLVCRRRRPGSISDLTNVDSKMLAAILETAAPLLSGEKFPPGYAARWRQRTRFGALRIRLARSKLPADEDPAFGLTSIDHQVLRILTQFGARRLAEVYLFLRLRWFDTLPTIVRLLRHRLRGRQHREPLPVAAPARGLVDVRPEP